MNIAISTRDFLHLGGARDFLRFVIRGVKSVEHSQVFILVDIAFALTDLARSRPDLVQSRIENLISRKYSSKTKGVHFQQVCADSDVQLVYSLRERLSLWLGAETLEGTKLLPYSGDVKGIDSVCKRNGIHVVIPTMSELATPFVSYLYDCQHKHLPENFSANEIDGRDKFFAQLIENSPAIIVNSKSVKKDLIEFYNAKEDAIFALPFTPPLQYEEILPAAAVFDRYSLPAKYFLISNQFWVHKSLETTILALRKLLDEGVSDAFIVFTGEMHDSRFPDYVASLMGLVESLKLSKNTAFLGYIPKGHQLAIMKRAVAVLQPTLFEGGPGGGSIYDSESLGVRSIVSDIPVNRELPVSDRLVLFEAKNPQSLVDKMRVFWFANYVGPSSTEMASIAESRLSEYANCLEKAMLQAILHEGNSVKNQTGELESRNLKISVISVVKKRRSPTTEKQ